MTERAHLAQNSAAKSEASTKVDNPIVFNSVKMGTTAYGCLIRARKSKGITQAQVAARIGISTSQFNRVENGHDTLDSDQFFAWAVAVGCSVKVTRNDVL